MKASWLIQPGNLVAYGLVLAVGILTVRLQLDPWIVVPAMLAMSVVHFFVLPVVAMRKLPAFDAELRRKLVTGKPDDLLGTYHGQLLLRIWAPPGLMKHRLGQIHVARRAWGVAFQAYHEAMRAARREDEYAVMLGFAESGFHVGEDAAILPALARIAADPRTLAGTHFMLVHVLVSNPDRRAKARPELDRLARAATDRDEAIVALAEAEVLAAEGKHEKALSMVQGIGVPDLPETLAPLATLLEAKLLYVAGRKGKAEKLFERVRKDACCGRARMELEEFQQDQ